MQLANVMDTARQVVFDIEKAILKNQEQVQLKVNHIFSHGVYARELHIPAGVILTGEIHKYENLNILSKGIISVLTAEGWRRIEAPFTIVSPSGTKRIAYTHSDCVWTTIHGTFDRDVEKIKEKFIATTEEEYLEFKNSVEYLEHCGQLRLELQ